jgi:hypothetical protein
MLSAWSILNKVADRTDARFSDTVLIVCPNVTHGKTCLECRLCAIPDRVAAIGFPSHGTRKRLVDSMIAGAS